MRVIILSDAAAPRWALRSLHRDPAQRLSPPLPVSPSQRVLLIPLLARYPRVFSCHNCVTLYPVVVQCSLVLNPPSLAFLRVTRDFVTVGRATVRDRPIALHVYSSVRRSVLTVYRVRSLLGAYVPSVVLPLLHVPVNLVPLFRRLYLLVGR